MPTLVQLLDNLVTTQTELSAHLDSLASSARIDEALAVRGARLARLFELAAGTQLALEDLVEPGDGLRWEGRNSLPLFSRFAKILRRHADGIVGHNSQAVSWATGPGYFTVVDAPGRAGEILFDYTRVPAERPEGWPTVLPNERGLSHFIYKDLHDFCRRVSRHVVIGQGTRLGQPMDSYFLLVREESPASPSR